MRERAIIELVIVSVLGILMVAQGKEHSVREPSPFETRFDLIRHYTIAKIDELWHDLFETNDINEETMKDIELLKSFQKLNENVTEAAKTVNKTSFYYILNRFLVSNVPVQSSMESVDWYYRKFREFQKEHGFDNGTRKPQSEWTKLANMYLNKESYALLMDLQRIHIYGATKVESDTWFNKVLKEIPEVECFLSQSAQQTLYNLYKQMALVDLKGYVLIQFSHMLLQLYKIGNYTADFEQAKTKYEARTVEKISAAREAMLSADRSVFNCDPKQFKEDVTYAKLNNFLQGYIENEVNLNPEGTCKRNCAYYTETEVNGCYEGQFCSKQRPCEGKVVKCRYFDSDMDVCKSSDKTRRYDWVEYENYRILGNRGTCPEENLFKVESWWRYFYHCSYCFCFCDETTPDSDRYFNLREVTSDLEQNMVVTGVRIIKVNQIIHLQIQQGLLEPRGFVNQKWAVWKDVDDYKITDDDVTPNIDYHKMNWHERAIDLDDVLGPAEHVLTGVRFRKLGTHVNLEIKVSRFNFTTGEISKTRNSYWIGNDNTETSPENTRTKVEMVNPDIPIDEFTQPSIWVPNIVHSNHDRYVAFQPSSEDIDVAQNAVPYFDTQPITSNGSPLSGMGLIYRTKNGSGGFLAPKLISYDFAPSMIS